MGELHATCDVCGVNTGSTVPYCKSHWPWRHHTQWTSYFREVEVLRSQLAEAVRERDAWQERALSAERNLQAWVDKIGTAVAALESIDREAIEGPSADWQETVGRIMGLARQALVAIRADSPRPAPLSPEAKAARKPPPPESLVGALQERVHVERGDLIASQPIRAGYKHDVAPAVGENHCGGERCHTATRFCECDCIRCGPIRAGEAECTCETVPPVIREVDPNCPQHGKAREVK